MVQWKQLRKNNKKCAEELFPKHTCFTEITVHYTSFNSISLNKFLYIKTNKNLFKKLYKRDEAKWSSAYEYSQANIIIEPEAIIKYVRIKKKKERFYVVINFILKRFFLF